MTFKIKFKDIFGLWALFLQTQWVSAEFPWWEVEKNTEVEAFRCLRSSNLYLRRAPQIDLSGVHSCYEFKVTPFDRGGVTMDSGHFCYPSIIVTGVRKAATSAMYSLLAKFDGAVTSGIKENCPFVGERSILDYFRSLPGNLDYGNVVIDGCTDLSGNMEMRKLLKRPSTFYLLLTRDYSNWVWSAYNYWCSAYEDYCDVQNYWADKTLHKRSAGDFAEIVRSTADPHSSGQNTSVFNPLRFHSPCEKAKDMFGSYFDRLWDHVDPEDTMVVASESLETDPAAVWAMLDARLGFAMYNRTTMAQRIAAFAAHRVNNNDNKGMAETELNQYQSGVYAISHYQPLDDRSRATLSKCWHDDCLFSSLMTSYNYSTCATENVAFASSPSYSPEGFEQWAGALPVAEALKRNGHSFSPVQRALSALPTTTVTASSAKRTGFLQRRSEECASRYGWSSSSSATARVAEKAEGEKGRYLVLSGTNSQARFMKGLFSAFVGPSAVFRAGESECPTPQHRYFIVDAGLIGPADKAAAEVNLGTVLYKLVPSSCQRVQIDEGVAGVVEVHTDQLLVMWLEFSRGLGDGQGPGGGSPGRGKGRLVDEEPHTFDWSQWDAYVNRTMPSVAKDYTATSTPVASSPSAGSLRFSFEKGLLELSSGGDLIFRLLQFVGIITQEAIYDIELNRVLCAATAALGDLYDWAQTLSPTALKTATSATSSEIRMSYDYAYSTTANTRSKCLVRYARRTYRPLEIALRKERHPVVLLTGTHHPATVRTRVLVEHATAFYTGSMETIHSQRLIFPAEHICGLRQALVQAEAADVTIKLGRGGQGLVTLTNWGKKKCLKGMIRSFSKAVLQVRDPFVTLFDRFVANHNLTSLPAKEQLRGLNWALEAKNLASQFTPEDFLPFDFRWASLRKFMPGDTVLVISGEALIFGSEAAKMARLEELLRFAHHDNIQSERVGCAYEFINNADLTAEMQRLDAVKAAYQEGDAFCQVSTELKARLADVPYRMSLMFEIGTTC